MRIGLPETSFSAPTFVDASPNPLLLTTGSDFKIYRRFIPTRMPWGTYARFIQQYEEGSGDSSLDRHQSLGDENARTTHEQAAQRAATGELPRPAGAKLLSPNGLKSAPIKPEAC